MSLQNANASAIQEIRLWKIEKEALTEIGKSKLNFENRLQSWIASDISIISPDLLVIGREVPTDFGGFIDILCMKENGDLVIVELKRDKTPREITAQVLDYASWVKTLTADQIQEKAEEYCKPSLDEVYLAKFNNDLPETLNQDHELLVVGSEIDSSSKRIIEYLSETGVPINAVTFNYFKEGDSEFIARTFLIEPSKAEMAQNLKSGKRTRNLTWEQLQSIADGYGVGKLYKYAVEKLTPLFDKPGTTHSTAAFVGNQEGQKTIFSLVPGESSLEEGLAFRVYLKRFARQFNMNTDQATSILPANKRAWIYQSSSSSEYAGFAGFFKDENDVNEFLRKLTKK